MKRARMLLLGVLLLASCNGDGCRPAPPPDPFDPPPADPSTMLYGSSRRHFFSCRSSHAMDEPSASIMAGV